MRITLKCRHWFSRFEMGIELLLYISLQWTTEYLQVEAIWGHFGEKRKLEKILFKLHCIRWINKFRFILEAGKCESCRAGRGYPPGNLSPPLILSNHQ